MEWLRNFLKLRKQNDYVKIMFLLFLLGVFMLGNAIYHGVEVYHELQIPVEYILSAEQDQITSETLENLTATEGVDAATAQKETNLKITYSEEGESFTCYQISSEYLQDVYHTKSSGGMKIIYLTPKAYERVIANSESIKDENGEFQSKYQMGEEEQGVAKFVLFQSDLFSDEKIAFYEGNSVDLSKDCNEVRTYIAKKNLDGTLVKHIENLGYSIENADVIRETEHLLEIDFLKIKYDIVIGILCLGFVIIFGNMFKKKI